MCVAVSDRAFSELLVVAFLLFHTKSAMIGDLRRIIGIGGGCMMALKFATLRYSIQRPLLSPQH